MSAATSQSVLRFVTAGSVDDGKSTLIGRLLYDSKALLRDQIAAVAKASPEGADVDLSLVTDGLEAEREQGITIDVAYRYFATPRRSFVVADAPGHEQYTRNMVTAASTADVAVVLIDAARVGKGPLTAQTRRHAAIAHLLGLGIVVAVNKMDAVGWSEEVFAHIRNGFACIARALGAAPLAYVPISAREGDNVAARSAAALWYGGPSLLEVLEEAPAILGAPFAPFRFPVQRVARFAVPGVAAPRGYQGRVESGAVAVGDEVEIAPAGARARIAAIHTVDGLRTEAAAGDSVTLFLDADRDVTRGDVLAAPGVAVARELVADLCWLDATPWTPGRAYLLRQGARTTNARVSEVLFVRDVTELSGVTGASSLTLNDIASVRVKAQTPLLADLYAALPATGSFVLIDPVTNQTAAAGMIRAAA